MFYAVTWIIVVLLLALWSLAVWALNAIGVWTVSNAGVVIGGASVQSLRLPQWLEPWVPPEIAQSVATMLADLAPLIDGVLQSVPALAGAVSVAAWVLWAFGAVVLIAFGAVAHVLIGTWRRRSRGGPRPAVRAISSE